MRSLFPHILVPASVRIASPANTLMIDGEIESIRVNLECIRANLEQIWSKSGGGTEENRSPAHLRPTLAAEPRSSLNVVSIRCNHKQPLSGTKISLESDDCVSELW